MKIFNVKLKAFDTIYTKDRESTIILFILQMFLLKGLAMMICKQKEDTAMNI